MDNIPSFSAVAAASTSIQKKSNDLTIDDFPALSTLNSGKIQQSNPSTPANTLLSSDSFGLLGLIDVIRMTNEDLSTLALGTDLTALGLNLNGPDLIFPSFMSPYSENPTAFADPEFNLPQCYILPSPLPNVLSKISTFSDETLFYIFYAFPRDASQEASAQELFNRSWRYHKELKLWLCKDPSSENSIKGPGCERGFYIFFDPSTWNRVKKEWVLYYDQIEERGSLDDVDDHDIPGDRDSATK